MAADAFAGENHGSLRPDGSPVDAPVNIPADRASTPTALIELDGSDSYNPEGEDLHFQWRQVTGPRVELSDPKAPKPYFRTNQPGYYQFELVVTANGMKSDPYVLDFEIEMMNLPPVAKTPEEVRGEVGKLLEIDGRESFDPEGATLTYRWRPLTRGMDIPLSALSRPVLSFQPDLDGIFEVELVVSDGESVSQPSVTRLLIRPQPKPPVARAKINALEIPSLPNDNQAMAPPVGNKPVAMVQGPTIVEMGKPVMLDARGSRGSGSGEGRLEYLWRQKSGPFISDFELIFNGAAERFTPPRTGDYEFELVVSDDTGESAPALHRVKVVGESQPPVAVVDYPARAMPGALVKMDATQSYDLEGSELDFRWRQTGGPRVLNYVIDETLGRKAPSFYPQEAGIYSFELIVDNGRMRSKPFEIDIEVGDVRRPPNISISGPEVATVGARVQLTANAEDAHDRRLSFVWRQIDGPARALPDTNGGIAVITPLVPGRYVIDMSALEHGKVIATARRTLEVFDQPGTANRGGLRPEQTASPANVLPPLTPVDASPTSQRVGTPSAAAPRDLEYAPRSTRPAAQIHPATSGSGRYGYDSGQSALAPLQPLHAQ